MMNTNIWEWAVTRQAIEGEGTLEKRQWTEDMDHFAGLHVLVSYRLCFKDFKKAAVLRDIFLLSDWPVQFD